MGNTNSSENIKESRVSKLERMNKQHLNIIDEYRKKLDVNIAKLNEMETQLGAIRAFVNTSTDDMVQQIFNRNENVIFYDDMLEKLNYANAVKFLKEEMEKIIA